MELNSQKKSTLKAQFNSLSINEDDFSILKGKVIIHDFLPSWNNQCITEEVCVENMSTLIGKRIVCRYIPSSENEGVDALTNHEETASTDREGNPTIITNTAAIGFIENVYIDDYIDENGNSKRVLYGDVVIWNDDKYSDIVGLLQEWISRNVKVHMSVEYLYRNYNVIEGIEYLQSPIVYVAHTLLNSEQRGDYAEILPAYDVSTLISLNERQMWNKAINELSKTDNNDNNSETELDKQNNQANKEENVMANENKMFKKVCELSFSDIRSLIYSQLQAALSENEYSDSWISDVYETYFILSYWNDSTHKYFKVSYTKNNDTVTIDWGNRTEVFLYQEWKEIPQVQQMMNELNTKVDELTESLNTKDSTIVEKEDMIKELNSKVETLTTEKDGISTQFNQATEKITSLNSLVEELKPIKEKYETEQYEKALNEKKEYYAEKFLAVNAEDKFESENVQELIIKSLNASEEGKEAILSLNTMLVDLVMVDKKEEKTAIKELCSKQENLIPVNVDFDSRYSY